jgi:hypothetical protein
VQSALYSARVRVPFGLSLRRPTVRGIVIFTTFGAYAVALIVVLAPWGASTMDGGLILAQTDRVLHGEVPHLDFITPRPAGSAYLHILDFLLPLPLVLASRVVVIGEFVSYSVLFGLVIFDRRLRDFSPAAVLGICAAVLISIQQFLIIPFYTIDALVLLAGGFLLLEHGLRTADSRRLVTGALLLGVAATTKQSFWFAPIIGGLWVLGLLLSQRRVTLRQFVWICVAGAAPMGVYAAWVSVHSGGFSAMRNQLFGTAPPIYGKQLLYAFTAEPAITTSIVVTVAVLGGAITWRQVLDRVHIASSISQLAIRIALTAIVLWAALRHGFTDQQWSRQLFWAVLVMAAIRSAARRSLDVSGFILLASAWMVSLSWGAPFPALVAGSLTLYLLAATWEGAELPMLSPWLVPTAAAAISFIVVGVSFWHTRVTPRKDAQDVPLGSFSNELRGISGSTSVATLFRDARDCAARYPARWTALIPEGALMSPVLGFHSPLSIDWFWKFDYTGRENQILNSAARTDARGNYLILFQTAPQGFEADAQRGRVAPFYSDKAMADELLQRLHGRRIPCGSLVAVYKPGA